MSTASLLLPLTAVPESHVQTAAPGVVVSATAHVNFKIVIPTVLSLRMGDGNNLALHSDTVAIMSNGHNVSLNTTERAAAADTRAHSNLILISAARKGIAQDAHCKLGIRAAVCTVSTP
ncbi:MAG: hypothetical protein ABJD53_12635 [Gammaproteobacteria bacterium]